MKALVDAVLVGIGRTGAPPADPEDAGERLVARAKDPSTGLAPELPAERAVLLRLGVHAVRARAGLVPVGDAARPQPAPPETRPPCSPALAAIVGDLCATRNRSLLPEALARIDARGLRLPAQGLPALCELKDPALLPAAANVAGERGRWLARHNPAWRWLVDGVAPASLAERQRVWDEGTAEARLAAVRATRLDDPALARTWIAAVWKAEKASLREDLTAALAIGLQADDQPLLEQALADRAAGVRAAAAALLARLEGSPLSARARERADTLLGYEAPAGGVFAALKSRLTGGKGQGVFGVLSVAPPTAFVREWADDGIVEKPPAGTGERAFWLRQLLSLVPPAHWERRFGATAEALAGAAAGTEWADPVLAGWTDAAARFEARVWAAALWSARAAREPPESLAGLAATLFPLMDAAAVHDTATSIVDGGGSPTAWNGVLAAAPRPWSRPLADAFAGALARVAAASSLGWQEASAWRSSLELAAPALPLAALEPALALEPPPADTPAGQLRNAFDAFRSVVAIRKRIAEETRS